MKGLKRKLILTVFIILSFFVMVGNSSAQIEMPHAFFGGLMQTYLDNGVSDDLVFMYSTVNNIVLDSGLNPTDSIIGATVAISGAKRSPLATPGTTFTSATLSISDGTTTYFSATLNNIEFVLVDGLWRLNPDLDINVPQTLNLSDISLDPGTPASQYILDLQTALGAQSIAGMMMTVSTYAGDITGDSSSAILEGLIDGVPPAPSNSPPEAHAGVSFNQDQCLATSCEVTLDGRGSTDDDGIEDIVSYEWFENDVLIATGDLVTVDLSLGFHEITLVVTDTQDASSADVIMVVVDPAELSFIDITKAVVFWNYDWIKIKGKLALPAGISHESVNSVGSASISLSGGLGEVVAEAVDFEERRNGRKWRYHNHSAAAGQLHKFKIDWRGDKFYYQKDHLKIKSHHFGDDTTTLEIEFGCQFAGPVDIVIGSVTISIDENDNVTVTGATEYDVDTYWNKTEIEVVMPFNMITDLATFDISGTITDIVTIADYYTAAVGRFKIKAPFDSLGIDPETIDLKELTLDIRLGDEGFSGILMIDNDTWTKTNQNKWKYKAGH